MTLAEVMVGLGLAAGLALMVLLLSTSALSTDVKASERQIAAAVAESQLEQLAAEVAVEGSPARRSFWQAPDGAYSAPPVTSKLVTNGTEYRLRYRIAEVRTPTGSPLGGPDNSLRQVHLEVTWWVGRQGTPGYGELKLQRTRVLRESHVHS